MKKLSITTLLFIICASLSFANYVKPYSKKNGRMVNGYNKSKPNKTVIDNHSYKGNLNPHTGQKGKKKYKRNKTSPYYKFFSEKITNRNKPV